MEIENNRVESVHPHLFPGSADAGGIIFQHCGTLPVVVELTKEIADTVDMINGVKLKIKGVGDKREQLTLAFVTDPFSSV